MDLGLDADDLNTCVACGLCLPHCPTFRVTGEEALSPRGRIALMRAVQHEDAPLTDEVVDAFTTCVQCRGCEPACPSGVPYGRLIEKTHETLVARGATKVTGLRLALRTLYHPALIRVGSLLLALAQRLRLIPAHLGIPKSLPWRRPALPSSGNDAHLFTGCVMDAWQRDVHLAAKDVLEAAGFGVTATGGKTPCCGAVHMHSGLPRNTVQLAERAIANLPRGPILVDSAGCGAVMKEYGHLLKTEAADDFVSRVYDVQEWLAPRIDRLPAVRLLPIRVGIQDPCHLRHVQRVHDATRTVLRPFVREIVELDDDGLCCGAGGIYSALQPKLAGQIRERKFEAIRRAKVDVVVSANPGCLIHLLANEVPIVHPMQLVQRALHAGAADRSGA